MSLRIKNWSKHQHFKDRTPPWIKLYREILDDPDWHDLDGSSVKVLVSLWLIASEDETHCGVLPNSRKLAFRLRINEVKLNQELNKLTQWLIRDDIAPISEGYRVDAPETETETETESLSRDDMFERFWKAYPKKAAKPVALREWKNAKINGEFESVLAALEVKKTSPDWIKENGAFIPHPAKWIKEKRWLDDVHRPITTTAIQGSYI